MDLLAHQTPCEGSVCSRVAQRKRAGPITQNQNRNHPLLALFLSSFFSHILVGTLFLFFLFFHEYRLIVSSRHLTGCICVVLKRIIQWFNVQMNYILYMHSCCVLLAGKGVPRHCGAPSSSLLIIPFCLSLLLPTGFESDL